MPDPSTDPSTRPSTRPAPAPHPPASRRQVVVLGAATIVAGGSLAACGGDGSTPVAADSPAAADGAAGATEAAGSPAAAESTPPPDLDPSTTSRAAATKASARSSSKAADKSSSKAADKASTKPSSKASTKPSTKTSAEDFSAGALIKLSAVPVGGSVVLGGIVVTRTGSNSVVGHSSACTHQGCAVKAAGASLSCPCHGSRFAAASGAVQQGPAASPLPRVGLVVKGGYVHRS